MVQRLRSGKATRTQAEGLSLHRRGTFSIATEACDRSRVGDSVYTGVKLEAFPFSNISFSGKQ